jgi:hypothetical protein
MLKIEISVTIRAVEGPNIIRLARDMPKLTDTLPVFGRGAERLSEVKISKPKRMVPSKEIFLYLRRIYIRDAVPAIKTINT